MILSILRNFHILFVAVAVVEIHNFHHSIHFLALLLPPLVLVLVVVVNLKGKNHQIEEIVFVEQNRIVIVGVAIIIINFFLLIVFFVFF